MNFKVGDKVICVDDDFDLLQPGFTEAFKQLPVKDNMYTVRLHVEGRVLLEEIHNPILPISSAPDSAELESGFRATRFVKPETNAGDLTDNLLAGISEDIEVERLTNPDWYAPEEEELVEEELDFEKFNT